jgi:hypothetical protein
MAIKITAKDIIWPLNIIVKTPPSSKKSPKWVIAEVKIRGTTPYIQNRFKAKTHIFY